jgi:hypothetical protein
MGWDCPMATARHPAPPLARAPRQACRLRSPFRLRLTHTATYQAKYTHCSITCWHTPSFPGKASQETGTLALAGPIQPSPGHVALTLIPRDELLPNTDSLQRS